MLNLNIKLSLQLRVGDEIRIGAMRLRVVPIRTDDKDDQYAVECAMEGDAWETAEVGSEQDAQEFIESIISDLLRHEIHFS